MSEPRVLILSHGHPDFSLGGGEIAAHAHWRELRRRGIDAIFVARVHQANSAAGAWFSNRSADGREVLFNAPPTNNFRHSQPNLGVVYTEYRELLERFRPTIVHFHHYVHMGLELVRETRKYALDATIVMTLHEFLAICNAQGQMLKTNGTLCGKAAPLDCHFCYPDISPQDFFMRELFIKSFLNLVDVFVCPSDFLRQRYVDWGIPLEKTHVIENGQQPDHLRKPTLRPGKDLGSSFVSLGQLSRRKGTLVLLEAMKLLPKRLRQTVRLDIHGSARHETEEFSAECARACKELGDSVRMFGPYRPDDVGDIISRHGWVIQPSIWWENSPLVIQEAFACGRPMICSNIGGMAEKVTDGVDGLHFRAGSPGDLAATLEHAATEPGLWAEMCKGVRRPPTVERTVDELLALC
jgi:glycosyltransferase involved in cell wall biosynthesis